MADRQVRIIISADVASAIRGIAQVEGGLRRVGDTSERAESSTSSFGEKLKSAAETAGIVTGFAAVAGAITYVVKQGVSFQDNMNSLQAVTGANAAEMTGLSAKARALGSDLDLPATSAGDAAEAMLELSKGGLTVSQTMSAAKGSLLLAAAAQISGAEAASIQSNALNAFGLSADNANHVADVLANTANAASGEITDFAAGLQQSATVAHSFGIGIEDSATTLGLFAKAGIAGSDAGTSFKTMLTALASPTKQQQAALAELNLTVYDAQGQFVGMKSITEQLAAAKASLTQQEYNAAASTAFGSDAIRAANILAEGGVKAWDDMSTAVGKAGGAQELAAAQTQGLSGAFGKLMSGVEDTALTLFSIVEPAITGTVNLLGGLSGGLGDVVGPAVAAAGALAGLYVVSQVTGFIRGLLYVIPTIIAGMGGMAGAMGALKAAMVGFLTGSGPWVIAIAGLAAGLGYLATKGDGAEASVAELTGVVDANTGALEDNARAQISVALSKSGASDAYKSIGGNVGDLTAALTGNEGALARVNNLIMNAAVAAAEADPKFRSLSEAGQLGGQTAEQYAQGMLDMGTAGFGASDALQTVILANNGLKAAQADVNGQVAAGQLAFEGMQTATGGALDGFVAFGSSVPVAALQALHDDGEAAAGTVGAVGAAAVAGLPSMDALKSATADLASAAGFADAAVQFLTLSLDAASGHVITNEQATRANEAALRGIGAAARDVASAQAAQADAADKSTEATDKFGAGSKEAEAAQRDYDNAVAAVSDSLDKQFTANIQAQQSALALATAAYTTAGANGDLAAAAAAATASVEASKAAFIAAQPEADRLSGKANATADALFGIPSETVAKIAETGAANVQTQAGNVTGAVDAIPKNPHVTVTATDNATSVLNNINNYRIADKTFTVFQQSVPVSALEAVHENGGHTYAANGLLYGRGQSQRRTGMGSGVTWAEAATGEEFYLSMKPSMRDRNRSLTAQAAAQLGGQASFGDVRSGSFVPPQVPAQPAFSGTTVNGNQGGVHVGTINAASPGSVLSELDYAVKRSGL